MESVKITPKPYSLKNRVRRQSQYFWLRRMNKGASNASKLNSLAGEYFALGNDKFGKAKELYATKGTRFEEEKRSYGVYFALNSAENYYVKALKVSFGAALKEVLKTKLAEFAGSCFDMAVDFHQKAGKDGESSFLGNAASLYSMVIRQSPDLVLVGYAHMNRGHCNYAWGLRDNAIFNYEKALKLVPNRAEEIRRYISRANEMVHIGVPIPGV